MALEDATIVVSFAVIVIFSAEDVATLLIYIDRVSLFEFFQIVLGVTLLDVLFQVPPFVGLVEVPSIIRLILEHQRVVLFANGKVFNGTVTIYFLNLPLIEINL